MYACFSSMYEPSQVAGPPGLTPATPPKPPRRHDLDAPPPSLFLHPLAAHHSLLDRTWRSRPRPDAYERIYLITSGTAVLIAGNQETTVTSGQLCLIPSRTEFGYRCPNRVTIFWCHVDIAIGTNVRPFTHHPGIHVIPGIASDREHLETLYAACASRVRADRFRCQAAAMSLFARFHLLFDEPEDAGDERARLQPVIDALEQAPLTKPFSLAAMASLVGMSPARFSTAFHRAFGHPPARYRQWRRLHEAQRLLRSSSLTVDAIARHCGFCDGFHLSKIIRRLMGTTPSALRHQARHGPDETAAGGRHL